MPTLKYLQGYPQGLQDEVAALLHAGQLGPRLQKRYRTVHEVRTDRALYDYVMALKNSHLRGADPLSKIAYDNKLHVIAHALGTHTAVSRVQGGKLKAKREIRIATLFREAPPEFLRMIVVHELSHMKEPDHDKAFYQLCCRIEPQYHQLEFDVRAWLSLIEVTGATLWAPPPAA